MQNDFIDKLKQSDLRGRGGAGFPTYIKWQAVFDEKAPKKYIVCNGAEGELDLNKDKYILENYPEEIISVIKIALDVFENSSAFLYLKSEYYNAYKKELEKIIGEADIKIIKEEGGYIGGEETAICNVIEGKIPRTRKKPPFVSAQGVFNCPTLVNNIETFFYISKIQKQAYAGERFYQIMGEINNPGVFELKEGLSILEILKQTNNYPEFPFYAQVGGGAIGEILLEKELDKTVSGEGFISIIDYKTDPYILLEKWAKFFTCGNCDRCVPCREGSHRILEMIKKRALDMDKLEDLFLVLEKTSFCALGKGMSTPFKTLIHKIILKDDFYNNQ